MERLSLYDDKSLLHLVANGDTTAFRELFNRHRRKIFFISRKLLDSDEDAEDVLQEVFTKLWLNKEKLSEVINFTSYLNTVLRNELYNRLRKRAYADAFIDEMMKQSGNAEPTITSLAESRQLQKQLTEAINQLSPQQKKVFQLGRIEGYKQEEIAHLLGISKATAKKHMMEALRNLRIFLSGPNKAILFILIPTLAERI